MTITVVNNGRRILYDGTKKIVGNDPRTKVVDNLTQREFRSLCLKLIFVNALGSLLSVGLTWICRKKRPTQTPPRTESIQLEVEFSVELGARKEESDILESVFGLGT